MKIHWLDEPQKHDYAAAARYLRLVQKPSVADAAVDGLKDAKMTEFAAKDIFRSSALSLLGISNSHVERDRTAIKNEEKLSPILLVRDPANAKVIIADGYHRLCAAYTFDEDAMIPCKIV